MFSWHFTITPKRSDLTTVDILDISGSEPVILIAGATVTKGYAWTTKPVEANRQNVPWLFKSGDTRKTFRFVLRSQAGDESTLDQDALYAAHTKKFYQRLLD